VSFPLVLRGEKDVALITQQQDLLSDRNTKLLSSHLLVLRFAKTSALLNGFPCNARVPQISQLIITKPQKTRRTDLARQLWRFADRKICQNAGLRYHGETCDEAISPKGKHSPFGTAQCTFLLDFLSRHINRVFTSGKLPLPLSHSAHSLYMEAERSRDGVSLVVGVLATSYLLQPETSSSK
jgi:hypothetical protein